MDHMMIVSWRKVGNVSNLHENPLASVRSREGKKAYGIERKASQFVQRLEVALQRDCDWHGRTREREGSASLTFLMVSTAMIRRSKMGPEHNGKQDPAAEEHEKSLKQR